MVHNGGIFMVIINENDIDTRRYKLADWQGYKKRSDAYQEILDSHMKNCTTYFVRSKGCWAIVTNK